jgi:tol-pal system protein YbgF
MNFRKFTLSIIGISLVLLSASSFIGCSSTWRWVRHGTKVDTLEARVQRVDSLSTVQTQLLVELNADLLTEIENIRQDLSQLSAKIDDNQDNLSRVYQRLGISRNEPERSDTSVRIIKTPVDPDELYNTAYLDYTRANYDIAIDGFKQYLENFPDTELSDNAQYWVGECYYSKKMYPDAVLEFEKVINNYPDGNKVVAAIYKIGLAYESMNENKKAKEYYKRVFDNFPATPEAKLARERYNALP